MTFINYGLIIAQLLPIIHHLIIAKLLLVTVAPLIPPHSPQVAVACTGSTPCAATTLDPVTRTFGFACDVVFTCVQCQATTKIVEQHTHISLEPMQQQVGGLEVE